MLNPQSKHTVLLIFSTGFVNNETSVFNFVNNMNIEECWKVPEYNDNGTSTQYNITKTIKQLENDMTR